LSQLARVRLRKVSAECEAPVNDSEVKTMLTPDVDVQSIVADTATAEDGLAVKAVGNSVDADEPAQTAQRLVESWASRGAGWWPSGYWRRWR
jgi:hypothetical protein